MKINILKLLLGNLIRLLHQNSWSSQKLKKKKKTINY